jgi:hypothetical protein
MIAQLPTPHYEPRHTYCGFHVGRHVWLELVTVHVDGEEQSRRISADRITLCAD